MKRNADDSVKQDMGRHWLSKSTRGELSRSDVRMIQMAISKGWNVPEYLKDKIPKRMEEILDNPRDNRAAINAGKILIKLIDKNEGTEEGEPQPSVNVNVGVGLLVTQKETNGLTDEELDRAIDERLAKLASIEAKDLPADG